MKMLSPLTSLALATAMVLAAPMAAAQSSTQALDPAIVEQAGEVTAEARAVLDRMTAYLQGLQNFEISARITRDEVLPFGYKLQNHETARMTVRRPDGMRVDVDGDIKHRSYYYDGTTLTMVAPDEQVYARTQAPATIADVVDDLLDAGVELPLIDVLRQGFTGDLLQGVRFGLRVGESKVDGVTTDHLAFRQPSIDWQIWVARDGQPKKILITTRFEVGDPQYQAILDWKPHSKHDSKTFNFKPSKDALEIPFHVDGAAAEAAE